MTLQVREHVPLKDLTTLKIGGTARYFTSVTSEEDVREAIQYAREKGKPIVVLGGGSNVLITDAEVDALVVKMEVKGIEWEEEEGKSKTEKVKSEDGEGIVLAVVGAGESWDGLVAETVERGMWGLENLSGIPGTVGASPVQNIGAYGVEMKDVCEWVEVIDRQSGEIRKLTNTECRFEYRDSIFKHEEGKRYIVLRVAFRLSRMGQPKLEYKDLSQIFNFQFSILNEEEKKERILKLTPMDVRKAVLEIRAGKFPDLRVHGTAGSFFKNPIVSKEKFDELAKMYPGLPGFEMQGSHSGLTANSYKLKAVKVPLAWILDRVCTMKGYTKGNVALFERQPIVVVNIGNATAEEVIAFTNSVMRCVKEKTGIEVEREVREIGTK